MPALIFEPVCREGFSGYPGSCKHRPVANPPAFFSKDLPAPAQIECQDISRCTSKFPFDPIHSFSQKACCLPDRLLFLETWDPSHSRRVSGRPGAARLTG